MATYFLSINRGQTQQSGNVLVATSAPTADTYVQILTTHSPTRNDVIQAMRAIEKYILSNGLPGGNANIGVDLPPL